MDDAGLSQEERDQNQVAKEENEVIRFNPSMDNGNSLTDGVHIFTSGWDTCSHPATKHNGDEPPGSVCSEFVDLSIHHPISSK